MLICLPIIVVVIVGSEDIKSPFRLQVIVRGMSPLLMRQVSCATFPWSILSNPKENGTISGFSVNKIHSVQFCHYTIDFKFCRMSCNPSRIFCSTGVCATVLVIHRLDDKHTSLGPQHCGCHCVIRDNIPLQTPSDRQGSISMAYNTGQLSKSPLINCVRSKGEWNNCRFFCK